MMPAPFSCRESMDCMNACGRVFEASMCSWAGADGARQAGGWLKGDMAGAGASQQGGRCTRTATHLGSLAALHACWGQCG